MSLAALRKCAEGIGEENRDRRNNLDHEKKTIDEHFSCLIVNTLSLYIYRPMFVIIPLMMGNMYKTLLLAGARMQWQAPLVCNTPNSQGSPSNNVPADALCRCIKGIAEETDGITLIMIYTLPLL